MKKINELQKYFLSNSDKNIHKWHHYFDIYDENFCKYRGKKIILIEIGVFRGGSLKMWQNYFGKDCSINGIDIDPACKQYENNNTRVYVGDQTDTNFLKKVISQTGKPDIIIDDGGHTSKQQITSFNYLFSYLNEEGTYLVEDTHTSYNKNFQDRADNLTFIEFAKSLTDEINDWYRQYDYKIFKKNISNTNVSFWAKFLYSVSFYNSIVSFVKKRNKIPRCELR